MEICVKTLRRTVVFTFPKDASGADLMTAVEGRGIVERGNYHLKAGKEVITPQASIVLISLPVLALPGRPLMDPIDIEVEYRSRVRTFSCPPDMIIASLKHVLSPHIRIYFEDFCLLDSTSELDPVLPISALKGIITVKTNTKYPETGFFVNVRMIDGRTLRLSVASDSEVDQVKRMIGEAMGLYWDEIRLGCPGRCVVEGILGDYGVKAESTLYCIRRLISSGLASY
jgi:hypothetical protein